MLTNGEVKRRFMNKRAGRAPNLVSDGTRLLSYGWWEVARWQQGRIFTRNGPSYSMTTATKHRPGIVGGQQALTVTPREQAEMEL